MEYIAVIDLWAKKLVAIEPGRWGELQAQWAWSDSGVVVVDPQEVPSQVEVRDGAQTRVATYERPAHLKRIKTGEPPDPAEILISAGKTHDAVPLRLSTLMPFRQNSFAQRDCSNSAACGNSF